MIKKIEKIIQEGLRELPSIENLDSLENWRISHLGRNSALQHIFAQLGLLPPEQRPQVGQEANNAQQVLETAYQQKNAFLRTALLHQSLSKETIDVTLPERKQKRGRLHPSSQVLRRVLRIYNDMGFQTFRTNEVETDETNFQLLNIPPHHPARELQDTFYLDDPSETSKYTRLLRTQTSPGQIHAMRLAVNTNPKNPPPIRVVLPGMVYRYEQVTLRHETQFTQVEGLAIAQNITFSDLKGSVIDFARRLFGAEVKTRFRASHYPFTEPSADVDVECFICHGNGCNVCSFTGWIECIGCGMMHPIVLQNGGYNPEIFTGFAFGIGLERITLLYYSVPDIRYFWMNDLRFLEQF